MDGKVILKPSTIVLPGAVVLCEKPQRNFVSRGGDKLQAALTAFAIDVNGLTCLDVGASTGGFSDCLLKNGAKKVYAVENGKDQLAQQLKQDPRIISMEETDIRDVEVGWFAETINLATVDVSFISLTKILKPLSAVVEDLICLIKPQFEAGKGQTSKRGIIKDEKTRRRTVDEVCNFAKSLGLTEQGIIAFPETPRRDQNQEFLVYYKKKEEYL